MTNGPLVCDLIRERCSVTEQAGRHKDKPFAVSTLLTLLSLKK